MRNNMLLAATMALLSALATFAAAPRTALAQNAISSVAFVNGKVITNYDVDQRARLLELLGAPAGGDLQRLALDAMIDDQLKRDAARRGGISAAPEQIEASLAAFAAQNRSTPAKLEAKLRKAGVSRDTLRRFIETEVLWTTLIRRDFGPRSEVTDLELQDEIEAEGLDRAVEFDLAEIAIPFAGNRDAVMARVEDISARINNGEDYAALARKYSRAPTARRGGRLGKIPASRLPAQLVEELRALQPGQATRPLGVSKGAAVLVLIATHEKPIELTDEQRERIRGRMLEQRLGRFADGKLQELRAQAYIDRK